MRRLSNILTGDGGGQWSGCVCVNTSFPNTHTGKETTPTPCYYPRRDRTNSLADAPLLPLGAAPELTLQQSHFPLVNDYHPYSCRMEMKENKAEAQSPRTPLVPEYFMF